MKTKNIEQKVRFRALAPANSAAYRRQMTSVSTIDMATLNQLGVPPSGGLGLR